VRIQAKLATRVHGANGLLSPLQSPTAPALRSPVASPLQSPVHSPVSPICDHNLSLVEHSLSSPPCPAASSTFPAGSTALSPPVSPALCPTEFNDLDREADFHFETVAQDLAAADPAAAWPLASESSEVLGELEMEGSTFVPSMPESQAPAALKEIQDLQEELLRKTPKSTGGNVVWRHTRKSSIIEVALKREARIQRLLEKKLRAAEEMEADELAASHKMIREQEENNRRYQLRFDEERRLLQASRQAYEYKEWETEVLLSQLNKQLAVLRARDMEATSSSGGGKRKASADEEVGFDDAPLAPAPRRAAARGCGASIRRGLVRAGLARPPGRWPRSATFPKAKPRPRVSPAKWQHIADSALAKGAVRSPKAKAKSRNFLKASARVKHTFIRVVSGDPPESSASQQANARPARPPPPPRRPKPQQIAQPRLEPVIEFVGAPVGKGTKVPSGIWPWPQEMMTRSRGRAGQRFV